MTPWTLTDGTETQTSDKAECRWQAELITNLYTRVGHDAVRTDGWIDGFEAGDETECRLLIDVQCRW